MRRVVVTGMGMVTPVGRDLEIDLVRAAGGQERRRPDLAVRRPHLSRPGSPPRSRISDLDDYLDDADRWAEHSRNTQFALAAAQMAMDDSGLLDVATRARPDPVRRLPRRRRGAAGLPPVREAGLQDQLTTARSSTAEFTRHGLHELHPIREAEQEPGTPAAHLASVFGAKGPNANCLTACAASSQAIGEAYEMIRRD